MKKKELCNEIEDLVEILSFLFQIKFKYFK